jgi:hypothetical protein
MRVQILDSRSSAWDFRTILEHAEAHESPDAALLAFRDGVERSIRGMEDKIALCRQDLRIADTMAARLTRESEVEGG